MKSCFFSPFLKERVASLEDITWFAANSAIFKVSSSIFWVRGGALGRSKKREGGVKKGSVRSRVSFFCRLQFVR